MELLGVLILPITGAILARLGLIYSYTGSLIAYSLTNNIFIAVTTYLSISLGNTISEIFNITGNPELIAVTNVGRCQVNLGIKERELKFFLYVSLIKRVVALLLCLFVVGYLFPKIPLSSIPWFVYVVVFFCLIKWKEDSTQMPQNTLGIGFYAMIGGLCWGLAMYLNYIKAPVSVGFISLSAISSLLGRYIGEGDAYIEYETGNENTLINWLEVTIAAILVWFVPGLTSGAAAKTVFNKPNWLLGMGTIDILLEGWTLGTWLYYGSLSGKTMLGSSLQIWTSKYLTLREVRFHSDSILLICFGAISLAFLLNILIVRFLDPLYLTNSVQQFLPQIVSIPIIVNLIVSINDPIAIFTILLIAFLISILSVTPSIRALSILFVTAG